MGRVIAAIVAGVLVAFVAVFLIEAASHAIWPLPAGASVQDAGLMDRLSTPAKIAILFGWAAGTFIGALVALTIASRRISAWAIAVLIALSGVATMLMIPHPIWMWIGGIALPFAAAGLALRLRPAAA